VDGGRSSIIGSQSVAKLLLESLSQDPLPFRQGVELLFDFYFQCRDVDGRGLLDKGLRNDELLRVPLMNRGQMRNLRGRPREFKKLTSLAAALPSLALLEG